MDYYNILFSSVSGAPSFVHSPHVPNLAKSSQSSYLSILDPNIELPELSTNDIEEFLTNINTNKSNKDQNYLNSTNEQTNLKKILIIPSQSSKESEVELITNVKCTVKSCNQIFSSKLEQMKHFVEDHKEKVVFCPSCNTPLKSKYSLYNHFLVKPECKLKNAYRCYSNKCGKYFFSQAKLKQHLAEYHGATSFECNTCSMKFSNTELCDNHIKLEHPIISFNCDICFETFTDEQTLTNHQLTNHTKNQNELKLVYPIKCFSCPINGCSKYFTNFSNLKRHQIRIHPEIIVTNHKQKLDMYCTDTKETDTSDIYHSNIDSNSSSKSEIVATQTVKVYACPLPECSETSETKALFESHFLKHFTGELPGDINSLLPPDPPVPGLELHSKTFEANVDSVYQREETNLVEALDLQPDKLLSSLDYLDTNCDYLYHNLYYDHHCYFDVDRSHSDLTSALILPSTSKSPHCLGSNHNNVSRRQHQRKHQSCINNINNTPSYNSNLDVKANDKLPIKEINMSETATTNKSVDEPNVQTIKKRKITSISENEGPIVSTINDFFYNNKDRFKPSESPIVVSSCARTCPRLASSMISLVRRRRNYLRERLRLMQDGHSAAAWCQQPAARQPALQQVVRQIFTSSCTLPTKYNNNIDL